MNKLIEKLKAVRGLPLLLLAAAGIILVIAGSVSGNAAQQKKAAAPIETETTADDAYLSETEERIAALVRGITGRDCLVMLTLERGTELVYARDGGENGSYVRLDGDEDALLISSRLPKISGAAVICGPSESARLEIIELLCALLDLPSNRVFVR